jgi:PAS domain S-box-containing protein
MNTRPGGPPRALNWCLVSLSVVALLVCLFYAYATVYLAPYPGVEFGLDWTVEAIEPCAAKPTWCEANQDTLQVSDQLLVIGDLTHAEYLGERNRVPFDGYNPGEFVHITVRQGGAERVVNWQMLGPTNAGRIRRLVPSLLLCVPFWLAGTIVLLLLQPRDLRWWLLILSNYATAIWVAAGDASKLRVAYASPVQHALAWEGACIFLHLHLAVPSPLLRRCQRYFLPLLYAAAILLALLELFQLLPAVAFNLALIVAFLGSLALLAVRLLTRSSPSDRVAARLMLAGISLALGPGIVLAVIPALLGAPLPMGLALNVARFAIPLLPFFYIYTMYKRRLGGLEFRANRLLSLYSFTLLYATAFVLVLFVGSQWLGLSDSLLAFNLVASTVLVIAALPLRVRFQRLIDRLAYGAEHDPDDIIRVFANRIPAALSLEALTQLLADEAAPSLLIRQSALLLLADGDTSLIYARDVDPAEIPETPQQFRQLLVGAGRYRPPLAAAQGEFDWVRLAIPLEIRGNTAGLWLFGRRDPDDYYPQGDIKLLTTLASQVAVAIANAQLYDQAQRELAERKQAEEALRESEERYRAIFEQAADSIVLIDGETGALVEFNDRAHESLGYTREEFGKLKIPDFEIVESPEEVAKHIESAIKKGADTFETKQRTKSGEVRDILVSARAISVHGRDFVQGIWRDVTERKRAEEKITTHRRDLQRLSAQIIHAQEVERKRISQELHDQVGQALTAMSINLAEIDKTLPSENTPATTERVAETRALADQILEQIRELSLDLRPTMLDDLGLVPTLRWYVNRYAKRLGIEIEFEATDFEERLAAEVETALYRIVQEALTNVARHAQANRVHVRLECKASTVAALIEDNGQGFKVEEIVGPEAPERGAGLLGIRERVTSLGGRFSVHSHPGQGTRLSLEIPLRWGERV